MKKQQLQAASLLIGLLSLATPAMAQSALKRAATHLDYSVEAEVSTSSSHTPFWLTANKYGLSSVESQNGYLRGTLIRPTEADSSYRWHIGYGADVVVPYNYTSNWIVQQLYADIDYKLVRLTLGAKEQPMQLKDADLSTGSQALGINARPVPSVRIELPNWWNISGKGQWAYVKGHLSYGLMTDGNFQAQQAGGNSAAHYAKNVLLHTKAGYLKLGNQRKFPLTFEGGFEWATQFGGTSYNTKTWEGHTDQVKMPSGLKQFAQALYGGGGDATDGTSYANAAGNTLGSWLARLTWHGSDWKLSVCYDHYFEDHSQLFWQYGWLDGLIGVEAELPANRLVSKVGYEFVKTTYQSGPVYHDHTTAVPDQISGCDNYYNHNIYAGWQHWGQAMGNPLIVSPLYTSTNDLTFTSNRLKAHHVAITGNPSIEWVYRLLYTYQHSLGTYDTPYDEPRNEHSMLAEAQYAPKKLGKMQGWSFKATFGLDHGSLIGNNMGFAFTITKKGNLTH